MEGLIILRTFQRAFVVIPESAVKQQETLDAFKELVRSKVAEKPKAGNSTE